MLSSICGQHTITFDDGETGVLRIAGSAVNWDNMNKGILAGLYDNWRQFLTELYLKSDQDVEINYLVDGSKNHPYHYELSYFRSDSGEVGSDGNPEYTITKFSDTDYNLTIFKPETAMFFPFRTYDVVVSLDITLDAQGKFESLEGSVTGDGEISASFTAAGTPTRNNPTLN